MRFKTKEAKGITLIALVITIIVLLILAGVAIATLTGENGILTKANNAKIETTKAGAEEKVKIAVLKEDVKAGQIITSSMLTKKDIDKTLIPENAIGDEQTLKNYSLQDKQGNEVSSKVENGENVLYLTKNNTDYKLEKDDSGSYYIERNNNKEYIQLNTVPVVAKVSLKKNAVLTRDTISKGNNTTSDDVRRQEYNIVVLPTQIQTGDYVDIRLSLPNGQDYIVVAKKDVEIPEVDGTPSETTMWMNLTENEILSMSSAIVDAAKVQGSKLYATTYTEPGIQNAATPTYTTSKEVLKQIADDPNIVEQAKNELANRYNQSARETIDAAIQSNGEKAETGLTTSVQESITKTQEERKKYLDALESQPSTTSSSSTTTSSSTTK